MASRGEGDDGEGEGERRGERKRIIGLRSSHASFQVPYRIERTRVVA